MEEQSSRLTKVVAVGAVTGALAIAGIAVTGCGSDDNNSSCDVNNAIDSIQSQASSVSSQVQSQVSSISTNIQSQASSVQSQISTATQSNGGSGAGGY